MNIRSNDKISIGGIAIDLLEFDEAVAAISSRARMTSGPPLGVVSVNLDHVHHFGPGQRWHGTLDGQDFLYLLDGAPLVAQTARKTGRNWPRLAGSDIIDPLLDEAERHGIRVGFLGGTTETHELLKKSLAQSRPRLIVSGWWAPERSTIVNPAASTTLAKEIRTAGTQLLLVGLGKPRQELWMARYGRLTGAGALLGFGAAVDFLAGRVARSPQWVSSHGLEWMWRLSKEPIRMSRRYLVDGPVSYLAVRRDKPSTRLDTALSPLQLPQTGWPSAATSGTFTGPGKHATVTVIVVTYNNEDDVSGLISTLRAETHDQTIRVVVADNSPSGDTLRALAAHADVTSIPTGGNLGYAGGINVASANAGSTDSLLILNPDLTVGRGSIKAMLARLQESNVAAVVPLLQDDDASTYHSLRREPTLSRQLGDAVLGAHVSSRPGWLSEIDADNESYHHPHPVDWATGAAMLVRADVAMTVGPWDEQFFLYSEETDYCRRLRETGGTIWFEPAAIMRHSRGGSGASAILTALLEVNKVRYAATCHSDTYALAVRAVRTAGAVARAWQPGQRRAASALLGLTDWKQLPKAIPALVETAVSLEDFGSGTIVIPAHNEASVLARTLRPLAALAESGAIEVIVACNGCTDSTAEIARSFPGVKVLELAAPSKVAALNAADVAATRWPRVYLDADIEITAETVCEVLKNLSMPGALSARPNFRYDSNEATAPVRAYYRARNRVMSSRTHLWGAGIYALNEDARSRFDRFPDLIGDDLFVDSLFTQTEKSILSGNPVLVRTPRTSRDLVTVLRRTYRGNAEQQVGSDSTKRTIFSLICSVRGPFSAADVGFYLLFALFGRLRAKNTERWERDDSSRHME